MPVYRPHEDALSQVVRSLLTVAYLYSVEYCHAVALYTIFWLV